MPFMISTKDVTSWHREQDVLGRQKQSIHVFWAADLDTSKGPKKGTSNSACAFAVASALTKSFSWDFFRRTRRRKLLQIQP